MTQVAQEQAIQKCLQTIHGSVVVLLRNIEATIEPELLTPQVWKELYSIIVDEVADQVDERRDRDRR